MGYNMSQFARDHIKNVKNLAIRSQKYELGARLRDVERSMERDSFKSYRDFSKSINKIIDDYPETADGLRPYLLKEIRNNKIDEILKDDEL